MKLPHLLAAVRQRPGVAVLLRVMIHAPRCVDPQKIELEGVLRSTGDLLACFECASCGAQSARFPIQAPGPWTLL